MYLAPLNYDRFFKKVFSDSKIAKRFLEDFLDVEIEEFQDLKGKHRITDDASSVEFDYRCKINGSYVIIDMQQWYKQDIVKRFYLYHALNTGLQLENLPPKSIILDEIAKKQHQQLKKIKNYDALEPVFTLIWMVTDSLMFEGDFISYVMAPELVLDFIKNDQLWKQDEIVKLFEERNKLLEIICNDTKELDFLPKNRLIFLFQKNVIKNKNIKKYERWFEFAEKTRNADNKEEDFREYKGDEIFSEMMIRLRKDDLTDDDFLYIAKESEIWGEVELMEQTIYFNGEKSGIKKGHKIGIEEGKKEGKKEMAKMLKERGLEPEFIAQTSGLSKEEIAQL
jgi:hypothetical protein